MLHDPKVLPSTEHSELNQQSQLKVQHQQYCIKSQCAYSKLQVRSNKLEFELYQTLMPLSSQKN